MRRQGPLSLRHLVVAVLAVVVVNAQLSWWIIYVLRENRTRLRLERADMTASCEMAAGRVSVKLAQARVALEHALEEGGRQPVPPFVTWGESSAGACQGGWSLDGKKLVLTVPARARCVRASADPVWTAHLLEPPPGSELVQAASADRVPGAVLPVPLDGWRFRPAPERWEQALDGYRGRIVMVVSEGSFFAILILLMLGLLWRSFRREVELERQHQNFLAAITHELKSPLASMRLSLETVLRGRADGTASMRFLENALQDTERLQSLVQKVLEVTRYARGGDALKLRQSDLSALVDDTAYAFLRRATTVGAGLDKEIEPGLWANVDEEAMAIAVSNLLENAIKYGGTIPAITVGLRSEGSNAILTVRDNGKGIPDEDVPLVFDRFFRGGDEMTRTTEGTGLGLYLVRQIILAHGGTVRVAATGTGGTTFEITLPGVEGMEAGG